MKFALLVLVSLHAFAGIYGEKHPKNVQAKSGYSPPTPPTPVPGFRPLPAFTSTNQPVPPLDGPSRGSLNDFSGSSLSDVPNNILLNAPGGNGSGGPGLGVIGVDGGSLGGDSNGKGGNANSEGSIGNNSHGVGALATAGDGISDGGPTSMSGAKGGYGEGGRGGAGEANSLFNSNRRTGNEWSKQTRSNKHHETRSNKHHETRSNKHHETRNNKHHETRSKSPAKERNAHAHQRSNAHH